MQRYTDTAALLAMADVLSTPSDNGGGAGNGDGTGNSVGTGKQRRCFAMAEVLARLAMTEVLAKTAVFLQWQRHWQTVAEVLANGGRGTGKRWQRYWQMTEVFVQRYWQRRYW